MLYINAYSGRYQRLFLDAADILQTRVERELEVHTEHDGISESISTKVETFFLEIHYQRPGMAAPDWVAIPFGGNRHDAENMAVAINRLGQPARA